MYETYFTYPTYPKNYSDRQLALVGVQHAKLNNGEHIFVCSNCKTVWFPTIKESGHFKKKSWMCPKGCNGEAKRNTDLSALKLPMNTEVSLRNYVDKIESCDTANRQIRNSAALHYAYSGAKHALREIRERRTRG